MSTDSINIVFCLRFFFLFLLFLLPKMIYLTQIQIFLFCSLYVSQKQRVNGNESAEFVILITVTECYCWDKIGT